MLPDVKAGNLALSRGNLTEARECFVRALDGADPDVERICRNRLSEIDARIRTRTQTARIEISPGKGPGTAGECRVLVVTPLDPIRKLVHRLFLLTRRAAEGETSRLEERGRGLHLSFSGPADGPSCAGCRRMRSMLLDNLGREGALVEGRCPLE